MLFAATLLSHPSSDVRCGLFVWLVVARVNASAGEPPPCQTLDRRRKRPDH